MTLSLCMIVRDEAANLPTCLASVQGVVDEMVVVDTGSCDRTVEIAQEFGARVVCFDWCDDFAAARNASIAQAQGDWILVLDADETLTPDCVPALQQVMQEPNCLVATLLRQEVGAAQSPYSLISRLFRRHPDLLFSRPYHELIDDSVTALLQREPQWVVVELPIVAILHTGYQAAQLTQRGKRDRARSIMERFLLTHPQDAYICNKLGALLVDSGDVEQGLELLQRGLQGYSQPVHSQPAIEPAVLYELHYHLASTYSQLGNSAAAHHYQAAIAQPVSPSLKLGAYLNWGNWLKEQGQIAEAKTQYEAVLTIAPDFAPAYYNLGLALRSIGDLNGAIQCYQQAIQLAPDYAEAFQNLGVALLKVGQVTESLAVFRRAIALYQQQGSSEGDRLRQTLQEIGFQL